MNQQTIQQLRSAKVLITVDLSQSVLDEQTT